MNILEEFKIPDRVRASMVSIVCAKFPGHTTKQESLESLSELKELLTTLGLTPGEIYYQLREKPDPATLLGKGKLEEIAELARAEGSTFLAFDFELTATQARNIKEITKLDVIDRCNVILEIFAKHARTKAAQIQIEISRLTYLLPRLSSLWTHFSRQKGGIGLKGEGEQQLELDKRLVRSKIEFLKKQLEDLSISREEQRKRRKNKAITAALVGYTNVGKSSLMNRLCKVDVLEENKLFATLDSTFRMLNPDTHPPMILIDTVGFISNLPASLVSGFKTTLESALEADLLIIVGDISNPMLKKQMDVTLDVLKELGVDQKEKFFVFNKKDQCPNLLAAKMQAHSYPNSHIVSSFDEQDMSELRQTIIQHFLSKQPTYDLFIPYDQGDAHSKVSSQANIISTIHHTTGIYYRIRTPETIFQTLGLSTYILGPELLEKLNIENSQML